MKDGFQSLMSLGGKYLIPLAHEEPNQVLAVFKTLINGIDGHGKGKIVCLCLHIVYIPFLENNVGDWLSKWVFCTSLKEAGRSGL